MVYGCYALAESRSGSLLGTAGEQRFYEAIELVIVPLAVILVVWAVWKAPTKALSSDKARLEEAWHTVLADPNYLHRRRSEEYKSEVNAKAHKAEAHARKIEGL